MDKATAAILLTLVAHVLGLGVLVWLALDGARFDWRGWWPRDDGAGPGDDGGQHGGPPLPDAGPAAHRVRTVHDRSRRRRVRRPEHAPEPARTRAPASPSAS